MSVDRLKRLLDESSDRDNPASDRIRRILDSIRTIGVVGISRDPVKAARRVPSYMAAKGYEVIPVNPHAARILGRTAHASLHEIEEPLDLVLVFRPPAEAGDVVRAAARRPEKPVIWLQEGIRADEAAREAREAGLTVVQDLCIYKAHRAVSEGTLRTA